MKQFRVGIVGVGFVGKIHLETLRRLPNISVVAIADRINASEIAHTLAVPAFFVDYREMIDQMQLDCVHICSPNNTHYEIAMYALNHGVHVVCEKPMTLSIDEAEKLVGKVEETGLVFALNYHNRFFPMTAHLRHMVEDGELGKVFAVYGNYTQDWLLKKEDYSWRLESKMSGKTRVVSDIGSHWMDLAEYITGQRIEAVCSDFLTIHPKRRKPKKNVLAFSNSHVEESDYEEISIDTEDNAYVLLKFSDGAKGIAFFSQVIAGKTLDINITVGGYQKSAEWHSTATNSLGIGNRDGYYEVLNKGSSTIHQGCSSFVNYPAGHVEGFAEAFKNCFRQVYEMIEGKCLRPDYADVYDGLHEMKLCEAIYESNQKKCWVSLE